MTINCKGFLLDLSTPVVMGILNLTPDSFYDGGQIQKEKDWLQKAEQMLYAGAKILDLGGYSSKPNAKEVSEEEERKRVIPAIKSLSINFPNAVISIDSFRKNIVAEAFEKGASIVNDISAYMFDKSLLQWLGENKAPYILMHMKGNPQNMQQNPEYGNVVSEVNFFLSKKISELKSYGVKDIILDPGFGFGKTTIDNFELLGNLDLIGFGDFPLLAGVSRKSMIYKTLDIGPEDALNGTTALHMIALEKGAKILRVHDVKEAVECIKLYKNYNYR